MVEFEEQINRADALANRLRLVQADFADADADERRRLIGDEIERALDSIPPLQRPALLRALQDRFPAFETSDPSSAPEPRPAVDEGELNDPSFLTSRLCELAPMLSDDAKQALLTSLHEAGFTPPAAPQPPPAPPMAVMPPPAPEPMPMTAMPPATMPDDQVKPLRTRIGVPDSKGIDAARVLELATILSDFSINLHQLVGSTWRVVSPNAEIKVRAGGLQSSMGRFISGDTTITRAQLAQEVERFQLLAASLIGGIGDAGRQYAQRYHARFSPAAVKSATAGEPGGMFVGPEVKCWRKYVELWDTLDEAGIESEIRGTIATFVENIMKGVGH